ncbi:MAG: hypothetical protein JWN84_878 [Nocardioides sp.]|jgi:hypothetical protein|nr:hypothetical protein [Nocardioides sp.]
MAKDDKYTDPELRERIKEELKAGDKGGREGQWSARKSQMLVQEYERQGGGYRGPKDDSQRHLEQWTHEEWQTKDGSADARDGDETGRYLPKEAWDRLSDEEKAATDRKKRKGSRTGEQHVANTGKAKKARQQATSPLDGYDDLTAKEVVSRLSGLGRGDLEKVRDHERGAKSRKTVLEALDKALERD